MKKFLSILLSMIAMLSFSVAASADLNVPTKKICVGDSFTIDYTVPNEVKNVGAVTLTIRYDNSVLQATDISSKGVYSESGRKISKVSPANNSSGFFGASWTEAYCSLVVPADTSLLQISFKAVAAAEKTQISGNLSLIGKQNPSDRNSHGNDSLTSLAGAIDKNVYITVQNRCEEHELTAIGAVAATCTADGNIAHWECDVCGKYFSDADGKTEIAEANLAIPQIEHKSAEEWYSDGDYHWHLCEYGCETVLEKASHSIKTVTIPAVEPTDTELGIKAISIKQCSKCSAIKKADGSIFTEEEFEEYKKSFPLYAKAKSVNILDDSANILTGTVNSMDMYENRTLQLYSEVMPVTAKPDVTWKSSSSTIAKVDAEGLVTFLKPGAVTITATAADGSKKAASVKFDVSYMDFASNVKFTAKIAEESTGFNGTGAVTATNIGLQNGDSVQLNVFGLDKENPVSDLSVFDFSISKGADYAEVNENGLVTAVKAGGSVSVKAELRGDPLKRSASVTVKTIAQQLSTVSVLPYDMADANFVGVDANGELCEESGLAPVTYALMVDKAEKGQPTRTYRIRPAAIGSSGEETTELAGKFTWATTDSGVATVKENTDGSVYITIKSGVDGACTVSATSKDLYKAQGFVSVYVRDYSPRLEAATAVIDTQATNFTSLKISSSYGNNIKGVTFFEYDAKSGTSFVSNKIEAVYKYVSDETQNGFDEFVELRAKGFLKNQTIDGQLLVTTDGGDYPLTLDVSVKNSAPTVTIKQINKFNLFYTDSLAEMTVTVSGRNITDVELVSSDFAGVWDGEKLTVSYAAPTPPASPSTKLTLKIGLEGYSYPVEKAVTLSTETKKPSLVLDPSTATMNTSIGDDKLYLRIKDNTTKAYLDVSDVTATFNPEIASELNRIDSNTFELVRNSSDIFVKGGKVTVSVQGANWVSPIALSYTVKVISTAPTAKPAASTLTLNSRYPGLSAQTAVTLSQANIQAAHIEDAVLTPAKPNAETEKIQVLYKNGSIIATLLDDTVKAGSYSYSFVPKCGSYDADNNYHTVDLAAVKVTVKVINTQPTAKLSKTSLSLNNVFSDKPDTTAIIPTDASQQIIGFEAAIKSTGSAALEAAKIKLTEENGLITAKITDSSIKTGTYSYTIKANLGSAELNSDMKALTLSVKVVNTQPKVTLSATTANLNTAAGIAGTELAGITLNSATAGYTVVGNIVERIDTKADTLAQSEKIIIYPTGSNLIKLGLNATDLPKAATYKYRVTPIVMDETTGQEAALNPISFSVKVFSSTNYSATVSASGKLDAVLRDSGAITYTVTKLSYVSGEVNGVSLGGQDAELFNVSFGGYNAKGQPMAILTLKGANEANYATTQTYKVQLNFTLDSGIVVSTSALSVKVGNTSLKLTGTPSAVTVYQSQSRSRIVYYTISLSSPADAKIAAVEIGEVSLLQRSLVNESTNVSVSVAPDGKTALVRVVLKDTSALTAKKTYTLPLLIRAEGQASNIADAKLSLSLKVLK